MPKQSPTLTGKDKADCLLQLQRTLAENRRQTRSIEFRVNLSLWTLIAASVYFLYGKVHLSEGFQILWFLPIAIATYLAHVQWMRLVQRSEDNDASRIKEWTRLVEKECGLPVENDRAKVSGIKWVVFETSLTALLLIVAAIILWK